MDTVNEHLKTQQTEFAATFGLTYDELHKLMRAYTTDNLLICLDLLKTKKHRSNFRASCASQIRSWLSGTAHNLANQPLSKSQLAYLKPTWPITIRIPTQGISNAYSSV